MATKAFGLIFRLCSVACIVLAKVSVQDEPELFQDCCDSELDPGIGILAEPRTVVITRRSSLMLNCPVIAEKEFGNLTFLWRKNKHHIINGTRMHMHDNGTLEIKKVLHRTKNGVLLSDTGLYECFISNSFGTVLAQRVQVLVASVEKTFLREPKNQTVAVGSIAYFSCHLQATPDNLLVVWHKDDAILHTDGSSRFITHGGNLQIRDVVPSDAGHYCCQVTNKAFFNFLFDKNHDLPRWRISKLAYLEVIQEKQTQAPVFLAKPPSVTEANLGDAVTLECVIGGPIPSPTVIWKHNYAVKQKPEIWREVQSSSNVSLLYDGRLQINRVSPEDAGMYTCSDKGETIFALAELIILESPLIQIGPESRHYRLASMIRLECQATGHPLPKIRWLKDGQDVVEKTFKVEFLDDMLVIYHGNIEDSGYYQCLAENKAGWAISLARVTMRIVDDAPQAPHNVTAEALSSSSVLVTWAMDRPVGTLLVFTIHRQRTDGQGGEEVQVIDGEHEQTTLNGLEADTEYSIFVKAYSNFGASLNSKVVEVRTHLNAFPVPIITSIGPTSILLNWTNFHSRHNNLQNIAMYQIFYGPVDSIHLQRKDVEPTKSTFLLKGLDQNRDYRIRMAVIFKGESQDIEEENLSWSFIRTGLSALDMEEKPVNDVSTDGSTKNTPVPTKDNSTGSSSNLARIAMPHKLIAFPLKPNAVYLQWDYSADGMQGRNSVTHFTVRCQSLDSLAGSNCQDSGKSVVYKISHSNNAVLEDLHPFTMYNISVSAHRGEEQGPYSRPIYVQTKEDIPSKPENLQAQVIAQGKVRLYWQPPTSPNGLIQGHYIFYTNDFHLHDEGIRKGDDIYQITDHTWTQLYQQGNLTYAIVSNLTHQVYFFQVRACTAAGTGAPSTLIIVHMIAAESQGMLSDQHLGILGGSVIGISSIIITVIVIAYKQRQLRKKPLAEQGIQPTHPHHTELLHVKSTQGTKNEEMENLLPVLSLFFTGMSSRNNDSGDSGCSSDVAPTNDNLNPEHRSDFHSNHHYCYDKKDGDAYRSGDPDVFVFNSERYHGVDESYSANAFSDQRETVC